MNVLVTGAKGFIGTRVTDCLVRDGHAVTPFPGDILDADRYPQGPFSAVVHLASLISHRSAYAEDQLWDVNLTGTKLLLEHFPHSHFVFVSTRDVERPALSKYAESKLAAEREVERAEHYCIIRLPSVFGPGQRQQSKLIPRLLRKYVLASEDVELTNDARECLFVDEAAGEVVAGLSKEGVVSVRGVLVHNFVLNDLVAAAARNDKNSAAARSNPDLFAHLVTCAEFLRRQGRLAADC